MQRFVSLEFNKFLSYYKDLKDIRPAVKGEQRFGRRDRYDRNDRPDRYDRQDRHGRNDRHDRGRKPDFKRDYKQNGDGYDWLAIDIGKNNKILPVNIIGMVNQGTRSGNVRLGRIDIGLSKSWVQVESDSVGIVEKALRETNFKGRKLRVERASTSPGRSRKSA